MDKNLQESQNLNASDELATANVSDENSVDSNQSAESSTLNSSVGSSMSSSSAESSIVRNQSVDLAAMDLKLDDEAQEKLIQDDSISENVTHENGSTGSATHENNFTNNSVYDDTSINNAPADNTSIDNTSAENTSNDNISIDNASYDNTAELKKRKNSWKTIGIIAIITSVILIVLLVVMYFYSNQKIAEGTKQIKQYQRDLTNSKTVIAEYEAATQTKVVDQKSQAEPKNDEKSDDKTTGKQIVKWNDLNINFAQLTTLIGDEYRITGGRIVTNDDGTKVVAKISVSKMEKVVDPNGLAMPRYVDHGMATQTNVYTRKLPSGSWQYVGVYATKDMGAIQCKEVSDEMRAAVTVLNKYEPDANMKYTCVTYKNNNPAEGTENFVF